MKISLANPDFWLPCLFEFICFSCMCFIMLMKCWIKIVWSGGFTLERRKQVGGLVNSVIDNKK